MTNGMANTSFSMTTFNTNLWQMSFSDSVSTICPPHPSCLTWKKKLAPSGIISPNASLTFIFRLFKSPLKQTTRRCSAIQTSTDLEPSVPDYLTQWWHVLLYACANWLHTEHSFTLTSDLDVDVWGRWSLILLACHMDETVFPHKQARLSCLDVLQAKFTATARQNPSIAVLAHKIYGVQTRLPVLASSSSHLQLALYPSGNRPCMSAILSNLLNWH